MPRLPGGFPPGFRDNKVLCCRLAAADGVLAHPETVPTVNVVQLFA